MVKFKFKIDASDLMALMALLISFVSLWISISEIRIMKEETQLMRNQQKASVWPYLDMNLSFKYADQIEVTYKVTNKGIGPALINSIELLEDEEVIPSDYMAILDLFLPLVEGEEANKSVNLSTGLSRNQVLSPDEEMVLLKLTCDRFKNDQKRLMEFFRHHSFEVCYSSIYEDSWRVFRSGQVPQSVAECGE
jgi:hypothetical protein